MIIRIKLKEGNTIVFYNKGVAIFCCTQMLELIKREFELDLKCDGCSYFVNDCYVGRIACQGVRIYDKEENILYEEGKI
jgi:hypothetical protein